MLVALRDLEATKTLRVQCVSCYLLVNILLMLINSFSDLHALYKIKTLLGLVYACVTFNQDHGIWIICEETLKTPHTAWVWVTSIYRPKQLVLQDMCTIHLQISNTYLQTKKESHRCKDWTFMQWQYIDKEKSLHKSEWNSWS